MKIAMFIMMKKTSIRQKLIENLAFTFIWINCDVENFDLDTEIASIYNYIKESSVKLAVKSAEKMFKRRVCKRIIGLHVKYF